MANTKKEHYFEVLRKHNVSKHMEQKGQFNYLSWAYAVEELRKLKPDATWRVVKDENGYPYTSTPAGHFVEVEVTVDDISLSQIHPVLDHRNQTLEQPNAFQINTSIQRCLAKAIALHGLGLYIFRGEDLPEADPLNDKQLKEIDSLLRQIEDDAFTELVNSRIDSNSINQGNFSTAVAKLESKLNSIKEVTNE
tara:strand:- start:820 stop:1401 length:582 start_codon:yes stop_codon:yes gene_type:complete